MNHRLPIQAYPVSLVSYYFNPMKNTDKRIDLYISKAAPFSQPILIHIRNLVHKACPDIEEKIKWGFPHFDYQGMCISMAAFKEHCAVSFWKAALMKDPQKLLTVSRAEAHSMGHLGKIRSMADIPADTILLKYFKEAVRLNKEGIALPSKKKPDIADRKELPVSPLFMLALKKNKKSISAFDNFSYSCKKEYLEWINEAKTEETARKRIDTAIEWISEGKSRNWKYKVK